MNLRPINHISTTQIVKKSKGILKQTITYQRIRRYKWLRFST